MPKAMEQSLRKTAEQRGYGKERTNAYVYGTMRNAGWLPQGMLTSKQGNTARTRAQRHVVKT